MPSSPPLSSNSKMAYEEGDTHDGLTIWTPSHAYHRRSSKSSRCRVCTTVCLAILIFFLGISTGAFLCAVVYPEGGYQLFLLPSFLKSPSNSSEGLTNSSLITLGSSLESSVELMNDEVDVEGVTITIENKESNEDEENGEFKSREFVKTVTERDKEEDEPEVDEVEKKFVKANKDCSNMTWYSSRLPEYARPSEYVLTLNPNLTTGSVKAHVQITVNILEETRLLVLNAENLKLIDYEIKRKGQKLHADFVTCEIMTQWGWKMKRRLKKGDVVTLEINYELKMKNDLQGLYLSTHLGTKGKKTKSAATQFEPTFARKMLPCFDEPNFKAIFQVSVVRDYKHVTLSNMNLLVSKEHENGLIKDYFEKSVKMSTYLLAVAVLDEYSYVRRLTKNTSKPIEVRLYAPTDMLHGQSEFGLDTTIRALEFFESYFNISYPLDKIDLLALDDFSEGAMENWGLVTFRDSALLFNEEKASVVAKEHIALIICHEIAHQWFGNLVTMDWWNEVFLNEGFANYMEYKCVDKLFPEWSIMTRFYAENLAFSQEPDGFMSSRAIESDDDDSLLNLFDAINYHKAAAIIHMIAEMAGQTNFQNALIDYLNKYAYDNAKGVDLWKIVEKHANLQSRVSIPDFAKAFTTQVGYPLVTCEQTSPMTLNIHNQTRFLFAETENSENIRGDWKWPIPISYRTEGEERTKLHWLHPNDTNVSWELTSSGWHILNTGGVGYFKVLYDLENYKKLTEQMRQNHTVISSIDRSMILVDSFDLSRTSLLNITVYLDLVEYAENEKDKMTWSIISKQLRMMESLIEDSDYLDLFKDFQRTLIMKLYESLNWDEKSATPNQKRLQVEAFGVACRLMIKDCTKQAYQRYLKWVTSGVRNPEHHLIALLEGVKQKGTSAWERIWKAYKTAVSPSEKNNIIGALTSTKDVVLVNRILKYCLDGKIKPNLIPRVFSGFSLSQVTRNAAWVFFRNHFQEFHALLGKGSTLMGSCVKCLAEPLSTQRELEELKRFLRSEKFEEGQVKMEMTYEQIELNIQWRRLNEKQLGEWIASWDERRRMLYRRRRHHPHHHHHKQEK